MPIPVPVNRAYYYERGPARSRLYYWIPPDDLKKIESENVLKRPITKDYPSGIDVEVTKDKYEEMSRVYGLVLKSDPDDLLKAFDSITESMKGQFPRTGYIQGKYLEDMALSIRMELSSIEPEPGRLKPKGISLKDNRSRFRKKIKRDRKQQRVLKKIQSQYLDRELPFRKQPFTDVEMTTQDEPFMIFARLHQASKRRDKDGSDR